MPQTAYPSALISRARTFRTVGGAIVSPPFSRWRALSSSLSRCRCSRCRLRMNRPRSMPTPSTIPTPRSPQDEMRAHPRAPRFPVGTSRSPRRRILAPILASSTTSTPPTAGSGSHSMLAVRPAAGDRDLQPQPVAQPLKALQHAVLGHCETCGLAQRIRPTGRPDHRRPGSLLEIAELHGCPPKSRFVTLLALRLGHTRPAGLGCCSYPHSADVVGVFTYAILLHFSC